MFLPDVSVDRRGLLAAKTAIGALKSWLVAALVVDVAIFVPLQGEATSTLLALKRFLLVRGVHLQALSFRASVRFQATFADCSGSALDDYVLPMRWR